MNLLDVIVIMDETIEPPHPKMVVCVNPAEGWFFRINSRNFLKPCVPLLKEPDHPFLDHNSFLHCEILEIDDYIIVESIRIKGIIGSIHANIKNDLIEKIKRAKDIPKADQNRIIALLDPP